ncbi:MAG: hypothetical protein WCS87_15630 [Methylococcaceae bacterium]
MPESSHTDVKLQQSYGNVIEKSPSMALDTGILAGMTALIKIFCPDLVGSRFFFVNFVSLW